MFLQLNSPSEFGKSDGEAEKVSQYLSAKSPMQKTFITEAPRRVQSQNPVILWEVKNGGEGGGMDEHLTLNTLPGNLEDEWNLKKQMRESRGGTWGKENTKTWLEKTVVMFERQWSSLSFYKMLHLQR